MSSSLLTLAMAMSLGQLPPGNLPAINRNPAAIPYNASSGANGAPATGVLSAPNSTGAFNTGDQLYPFDATENWIHGYYQEIPSYGGYHYFRPYNYKHVLSQSQVAGGWGMPPTMPYSQEYFRRGRETAGLDPWRSAINPSAYTAEIARMRAQQEFRAAEAAARGANGYGDLPILPANASDREREDLQWRLQQQEQQLRRLQQTMPQDQQRSGAFGVK